MIRKFELKYYLLKYLVPAIVISVILFAGYGIIKVVSQSNSYSKDTYYVYETCNLIEDEVERRHCFSNNGIQEMEPMTEEEAKQYLIVRRRGTEISITISGIFLVIGLLIFLSKYYLKWVNKYKNQLFNEYKVKCEEKGICFECGQKKESKVSSFRPDRNRGRFSTALHNREEEFVEEVKRKIGNQVQKEMERSLSRKPFRFKAPIDERRVPVDDFKYEKYRLYRYSNRVKRPKVSREDE